MSEENEEANILPHHEQQELCTTRLPYRQGRKLTAVKVYTINNESRHLLIFGIPSLNLRREAKEQFKKFGKLQEFSVTTKYPTEKFTENYHAVFENIHAARLAKKKLDTMNFYGGSLHICYAPELESIEETGSKLHQRQRDVIGRLKNLEKEKKGAKLINKPISEPTKEVAIQPLEKKLNMGEVNVIGIGKQMRDVVMNKKRKSQTPIVIEKRFKPCFVTGNTESTEIGSKNASSSKELVENVEVIDCTSADKETITNINESLNYNKFGSEDIRTVPKKPVNKIKFNLNNK